MIHCNTELFDKEMSELTELRKLAEEKKCAFSPSISVAATRFISDARGDIKKALEKMQASQEWRKDFFKNGPITDADVRADLSHGVVYFAGRDRSMRPAIVARPSRVPKQFRNEKGAERLTRVLIFCLEYFLRYMAIPGQIENICVILDVKDVMPYTLPMSALLSVANVLSQQHAGRVWRFYVVNMGPILKFISETIKKTAMTDRQGMKIEFVHQDRQALLNDFAPDQLEMDLGGSRPIQESFFPFPLPPGSSSTADAKYSDVHKLLTGRGAQGSLWDPALSYEENRKLELSNCAADIIKRCHLSLPFVGIEETRTLESRHVAEPVIDLTETSQVVEAVAHNTDDVTQALATMIRDDDVSTSRSDEGQVAKQQQVIMEDVDICTPQVFSCMACRCTVGVTKREKSL